MVGDVRRTAVAWLAGAGMMSTASAAAAQPTPPDGRPDDIVVTGTKTATPAFDVPQSTSVVTRAMLDDREVQDLNGAMAYTPGVRVIDYPGGQGIPDIYLRGFRTINFLGIYRDGLRGGFNAYEGVIEPYSVDRIETLRGPASVLYGQGLPGGIINLVTKQPTRDARGEALLQTGSYDRFQGAFDVSGPLDGDGQWLYRMTALGRRSDTQVDYTHDDRAYIAPALTWQPDGDTRLTILTNYTYSFGGGSEQSLPASGTIDPNPNGKLPRHLFLGEPDYNQSRVQTYAAGYLFEHRFGSRVTFHSNTRYQHATANYQLIASDGGDLEDDRLYTRTPQQRLQSSDQVLTDNNLAVDVTTGPIRHTVLIGVDYSHYHQKQQRRNGADSQIDVFAPVYDAPIDLSPNLLVDARFRQSQTGVYAQDQLRLDRFVLTAGLRHDWAETDTISKLANRELDQKNKAFTGRVGFLYAFDFGLAPYVSYSTSFSPQVGATTFDGDTFDPTKGKQIEGGLKYQPPLSSATVTASIFNIDQTNVLTPDPLNPGYFIATGKVRSRGAELEAQMPIVSDISLIAAYSYTDAKVIRDNLSPFTGTSLEGKRLPSVPRNSVSGWLNYEPRDPGLPLSAGAGVRYLSASFDASNTERVSGYALVDAALRLEIGRLVPSLAGAQLAVNATNLFNKRYYTPGFYQGIVFGGLDRNVLVTLSYRW